MRDKIVAGNWKMNLTSEEAIRLTEDIKIQLSTNALKDVKLILIPSYIYLEKMKSYLNNTGVFLGAQDVSSRNNGAYTGEVSASMLKSIGVDYCLLGHSERRQYHKENNEGLSEKLYRLIENKLTPIFCIGETLEEREGGQLYEIIKNQLKPALDLKENYFKKIILAYEPVWAIGTGLTATSHQAQEMHAFIRKEVEKGFGDGVASETSILYGGSCKPSNAQELFTCKDVDGGLIGGASLVAEDFISIANSFTK